MKRPKSLRHEAALAVLLAFGWLGVGERVWPALALFVLFAGAYIWTAER